MSDTQMLGKPASKYEEYLLVGLGAEDYTAHMNVSEQDIM